MAIEKVKAYFEHLGEAARILTFEESTATVELAAEALGVSPGHIAKTLSFLVDGKAFPSTLTLRFMPTKPSIQRRAMITAPSA